MMSQETKLQEPYMLQTLALTEDQRKFFLRHGCSVLEGQLSATIFCPSGTTREDLGIEGVYGTNQGKGRLFLMTFPDGEICKDWYFPTGESHIIFPDEEQTNIPPRECSLDKG